MPPRSELEKHLVTVRRIAEHREAVAEKEMLNAFKECVSDLRGFIGNEYAKYAEDDKLTMALLQRKGEYARFVEEVIKRYDGITEKSYNEISSLVNDTYKLCYQGMVDGVNKCKRAEDLSDEFKAIRAVTPETVKRAVQNPIPKLRLSPTFERSRKKVISGIRREIAVGLTQGDRMSTMAERITNNVQIGYKQAMLIARTEAHRVREGGFNDAADEVDKVFADNDSEFRMVKVWRNMGDSAVRHSALANHVEMEGQTVLQSEKFTLVRSGAKADTPGRSGIASEDCNCRCYASRDIMDDEEFFKATGRHFDKKPVDKSAESDIMKIDKSTLKKYIGKPISETDNQHVREWYYANVSDIKNQVDKTKPFNEQVHQAFDLRNKYKHDARIAMSDEKKARELEKFRPAPTFEDLLKNKMKRKHMTEEEALKDILETASKTNPDVNAEFGL
jgi:outer membrane protein assembly factor BamE (lipoprotein component of BamABCDE complex)